MPRKCRIVLQTILKECATKGVLFTGMDGRKDYSGTFEIDRRLNIMWFYMLAEPGLGINPNPGYPKLESHAAIWHRGF